MKIALCFSGHLRTYKQTYQSVIEHLIEPLNPDVFIHTWDKVGFDISVHDQDIKETQAHEDELIKMYKPKKIIIEPFNSFETKTRELMSFSKIGWIDGQHQPEKAFVGLFYGINKSINLKKEFENENNFLYDVVFRLRFDLLFQFFDIGEVLRDDIQQNIVLIPSFDQWWGINDQFALSSTKNMNQYAEAYNLIDNYIYNGHPLKQDILLRTHLTDSNLHYVYSSVKFITTRNNL